MLHTMIARVTVSLFMLSLISCSAATPATAVETPLQPVLQEQPRITPSDPPMIPNTSNQTTLGVTQEITPTATLYLPVATNGTPPTRSNIFGALMPFLDQPHGLDMMAAAGAAWAPRDFPWNEFEPQEGVRDWNAVASRDAEYLAAVQKGFQVLFILDYTPTWALKNGYNCGAVAEDKLQALASTMYDLVKHYSSPPYNIKYYQVSNEPDVWNAIGCWGDINDEYYGGTYYGKMMSYVYPRVKEANPDAQFLVGGLLLDCDPRNPPQDLCTGANALKTTSSRFLEGIVNTYGGQYFDGVAFHAYDYYIGAGHYWNKNWNTDSLTFGPSEVKKAEYIRQVLSEHGITGKYLLNTEVAMLCGRDGNEAPCVTEDHDNTKAAYVIHAYTLAMALDLKANVWFYAAGGWRGSGLMDEGLNPNKSYYAFNFAVSMLSDARFTQQVNAPGWSIYEFTKPGQRIWVMWSQNAQMGTYNVSQTPIAVYDDTGTSLPVTNSLTTDWNPIFVVFNP